MWEGEPPRRSRPTPGGTGTIRVEPVPPGTGDMADDAALREVCGGQSEAPRIPKESTARDPARRA